MTRRLVAIDRMVTLVIGLALLAGGLALLDWRYRWVGPWQDQLVTSGFEDIETTFWWPWAFAAAGIVLGLLGLVWLLSHSPRPGERTIRLDEVSTAQGAARVDLNSVAKAIATSFEETTPVSGVKSTVRTRNGVHVIELRGHLDQHATGDSIEEASQRCSQDLAAAFPGHQTVCRVLLSSKRRSLFGSSQAKTPRVH